MRRQFTGHGHTSGYRGAGACQRRWLGQVGRRRLLMRS
jgi:hypothetical protein